MRVRKHVRQNENPSTYHLFLFLLKTNINYDFYLRAIKLATKAYTNIQNPYLNTRSCEILIDFILDLNYI